MNDQLQQTYIGADLGGTKLLIGEMDRSGKLLRWKKYPSGALSQREALELIQRGLDDFLAVPTPGCRVAAIGAGLVGRINSRTGTWYEISPAKKETLEIGSILSQRYGVPCFADNDVRSATKAELLFGKDRCSRDLIYLNIGTGIAAGFVSGGRLITGGHCNAGEVGHTGSGIDMKVPCECGRDDCVEPVASGLGFDRCARILAPRYPDTKLTIPEDGSRVDVAEVFRLYDTDPLCRLLTDNAAQAAANLIMNLIRFNDPDTIVLGGGVVSDGFLYRRILEKLNPQTIRFVTGGIVLTELDPRFIGVLGACSNAVKGMEENQ